MDERGRQNTVITSSVTWGSEQSLKSKDDCARVSHKLRFCTLSRRLKADACIPATRVVGQHRLSLATCEPAKHRKIEGLGATRADFTTNLDPIIPTPYAQIMYPCTVASCPAHTPVLYWRLPPKPYPRHALSHTCLSTIPITSASRIITTRGRFPDVMFRGRDRGPAALPPVSAHPHRRCRSISSRLFRWITIRRWWEQSLAWLCLWCLLPSSPRSSVGLSLSLSAPLVDPPFPLLT